MAASPAETIRRAHQVLTDTGDCAHPDAAPEQLADITLSQWVETLETSVAAGIPAGTERGAWLHLLCNASHTNADLELLWHIKEPNVSGVEVLRHAVSDNPLYAADIITRNALTHRNWAAIHDAVADTIADNIAGGRRDTLALLDTLAEELCWAAWWDELTWQHQRGPDASLTARCATGHYLSGAAVGVSGQIEIVAAAWPNAAVAIACAEASPQILHELAAWLATPDNAHAFRHTLRPINARTLERHAYQHATDRDWAQIRAAICRNRGGNLDARRRNYLYRWSFQASHHDRQDDRHRHHLLDQAAREQHPAIRDVACADIAERIRSSHIDVADIAAVLDVDADTVSALIGSWNGTCRELGDHIRYLETPAT